MCAKGGSDLALGGGEEKNGEFSIKDTKKNFCLLNSNPPVHPDPLPYTGPVNIKPSARQVQLKYVLTH